MQRSGPSPAGAPPAPRANGRLVTRGERTDDRVRLLRDIVQYRRALEAVKAARTTESCLGHLSRSIRLYAAVGSGVALAHRRALLDGFSCAADRIDRDLGRRSPKECAAAQLALWEIAARMRLDVEQGRDLEAVALSALAERTTEPYLRTLAQWAVVSRIPAPTFAMLHPFVQTLKEAKLHVVENALREIWGNPLLIGRIDLAPDRQERHLQTARRQIVEYSEAIPQLAVYSGSLQRLLRNDAKAFLQTARWCSRGSTSGLHTILLNYNPQPVRPATRVRVREEPSWLRGRGRR